MSFLLNPKSINWTDSPSVINMFYSLISRCTILLLWRYSVTSIICWKSFLAISSANLLFFCSLIAKSIEIEQLYSKIRIICSYVSKKERSLIILGWSEFLKISISDRMLSLLSSFLRSFFSNILKTTLFLDFLWSANLTAAKAPENN